MVPKVIQNLIFVDISNSYHMNRNTKQHYEIRRHVCPYWCEIQSASNYCITPRLVWIVASPKELRTFFSSSCSEGVCLINCLKVLISKIFFIISIRGGFKGYLIWMETTVYVPIKFLVNYERVSHVMFYEVYDTKIFDKILMKCGRKHHNN